MLQQKYEAGLTVEEFESRLDDHKALHDLHYRKNDVSSFVEEWHGSMPALKMIVITEPWCGDSLAIFPTLIKFFENFDQVEIKVVPRDENHDLMNNYLTKGGMAIPKFIVMDEDHNELFNWGPRPEKVQQIFEDHRADIEAGVIEKAEVHKKIRAFYSKDKGKAILTEFLGILKHSIE